MTTAVDLADLGLDEGGHLLLQRALAALMPGESLQVHGSHPALALHVAAWARLKGHVCVRDGASLLVQRGVGEVRERQAERAGTLASPVAHPPPTWGLAPRGSLVEAGGHQADFQLDDRALVWPESAPRLLAAALAAQWDPALAIDWDAPFALPDDIEQAVVQVMTYLIENETAALILPARFAAQVHPHFRETMQLLAIQAADEARHIEVFTRRASLRSAQLGLSTVGGRASLQTLIDTPDFGTAMFLLSAMGEASFLELLAFLETFAPDPVSQRVVKLAAQDEARHVAFALAHLETHLRDAPAERAQMAAAIQQRHAQLQHTADLNPDVFDALMLLAAGSWQPEALRRGWQAVQALMTAMDARRRRGLVRLGFSATEAEALSQLHTRNFM